MTIAQARRALKALPGLAFEEDPGNQSLTASREGVHTFLIYSEDGGKRFAQSRIQVLRTMDPKCKTPEGAHAGMPLRGVERLYGKLTSLQISEEENREMADFENAPAYLSVQVGYGEAGIYKGEAKATVRYSRNAKVQSLWISAR